jgi:hypothetical protein
LLAALHFALPGYARKFAMRGQVRQFAKLVHDSPIPVVCYPRGWDSVSFYLERDDVHCYSATERRQLIAELRDSPRTLAFIKSDHSLEEFLQDLPGSLQFVPEGGRGYVTVGWVQRRMETPLAARP